MPPKDERFVQLTHWLKDELKFSDWDIKPASEDASFRRYFRISHNARSYVVMDAPPEHEDVRPFLDITLRLEAQNIHVPHVHAKNIAQGFLLLDDLGSRAYLDELHPSTVNSLYSDALNSLTRIQQTNTEGLPRYDETLLRQEMELFREWFLGTHLGIELSPQHHATLDLCFAALSKAALEQPYVFVHRDFHSRNLMVLENNNPGVIDYQDAVLGPITYDQVSLLRDCYISWPRQQVEDWVLSHRDHLQSRGLLDATDHQTYLRWFDLMGVQRHLKAIGIFARLNHRDGKPGYLQDIPRTLAYLLHIAPDYPEIRGLANLMLELKIADRLTA